MPILKAYKTCHEQKPKHEANLIKTYADQKVNWKTLNSVLAARQNEPEIMLMKWKPIKPKAENLKKRHR